MKTYFKILLVISIATLTASGLNAQSHYFPFNHSPDLFLGKWTATNGDMSYEVEFTTKELSAGDNQMEFILGKITYKRNGSIVKKTEYNDAQSIIYGGSMRSPRQTELVFCDEDRLVWWEFDFTIDENNNNRAVWKFTKAKDDWMRMGWNETYSPDIPDNLVFRKVPNVDSGNPGGEIDAGGQR